jgi:hypothetical protein
VTPAGAVHEVVPVAVIKVCPVTGVGTSNEIPPPNDIPGPIVIAMLVPYQYPNLVLYVVH